MIYGFDGNNFRNLADVVELAVRELSANKDDFDAIAATGMSGVTVAAPVALRLDRELIVVRKTVDDAHGAYKGPLIGGSAGQRAIFLDDFVNTGATRARVRYALGAKGIELVGEYLYEGITRWDIQQDIPVYRALDFGLGELLQPPAPLLT